MVKHRDGRLSGKHSEVDARLNSRCGISEGASGADVRRPPIAKLARRSSTLIADISINFAILSCIAAMTASQTSHFPWCICGATVALGIVSVAIANPLFGTI